MNFTLMSIFPIWTVVFPLGFLGGLINIVGGLFGSKKKTTASTQPSFKKQLNDLKNEMSKQMDLQAQESKKTLTIVGIGAIGLVIVMFLFLKK